MKRITIASGSESRHRRAGLAAIALAGIVPLLAACGSGAPDSASAAKGTQAEETPVDVTLNEYSIKLDRSSIPSGKVDFEISNRGASTHEFVVIKTDLADESLPMTATGDEVNEDKVMAGVKKRIEAEDIAPGSRTKLVATLKPGNYVLICNVGGHYGHGMHAELKVEA